MGGAPSAALAPPGGNEGAEGEDQGEEPGQQRYFLDAGDDVVAIGAEADPIASGAAAVGRDAAQIGQRARPDPVDAAAGGLRRGLELLVGGADVGELDGVEGAGGGERGPRAVGDAVEAALGDGQAAAAGPAP